MTHVFDMSVRDAVLAHMNGDHGDDNLLIAQAFGPGDDVVSATMTGFDGDGGSWEAHLFDGSRTIVRAAWLGGAITQRPEVRREIVALYDEACRRRGVEPRPHG
ncbi:DUF2470 domain-containing protein [Microbacterium sp. NPDC057407]|uniref:DUF2470 domain-containing protein n=1 Tax=Microbacterium sp. NPDC057407 TaxID=3346120 RepID=UPI00366CD64A